MTRKDQFVRPAMMPRYDCEDEMDAIGPEESDDDAFFD